MSDDPHVRKGLAQAQVNANREASAQLTFRKIDSSQFGNRLTITVHWSHRPSGQFALRNDKTVRSAAMPARGALGGYQNDQQIIELRQQLLTDIGRSIGEEIQAYERNQT